jgi:3',5'-cyclic AMP phosphodiesterase CpdA
LEDKEFQEWLLDQIGTRNPDVIVDLGDAHEAISASRWPHEYDWTLSDEFKASDAYRKEIRRISRNSRKVFLRGNHDDNLLTLNRIDRQLRDLCDYRDHEPELQYWKQPTTYEYSRENGVFRLGQATFGHGWEAGVSADEMQSILLGVPYGLWVGGHTHRPEPVTQAMRTKAVPLPYWYANPGCARDIDDVPYMERKRRHRWGQGIVVGESGHWRYEQSLMPQSPQWEAETIVFRMFEDA